MKKKKLTYNSLAFSTLKNRKKSYALMIIGIVLAMIFSSGVPFFVSCLQSSRQEMQYRKLGKQTTIITNAQNYELNKGTEDGSVVGEIGYAHIISYAWNEKEDFSDGTMIGWLDEKATELYYPIVLDGRMPEKENEIAIGNVVGSNIFNIIFILGLSSTIRELPLLFNPDMIDMLVMLVSGLVIMLSSFIFKKFHRVNGILIFIMYVCYLTYIIIRN